MRRITPLSPPGIIVVMIATQMCTLLASKKVTVVLRSMKCWGLCDYKKNRLSIRESLGERNKVRTLVHECAHYLYPELTEKTILCIERDVYRSLTGDEYSTLLRFLKG